MTREHMDSTSSSGSGASPAAPKTAKFFYAPQPVAWLVLAVSILASAGGWFISWKSARLEARKSFDEGALAIAGTLRERMEIYQNVLHGAAGLFAASQSVERSEWRNYVRSVSIEQRFPGVDAVGYVQRVPRDRLESFLAATRVDGSPEYEVRDGQGDGDLLLVKYIEPELRHSSTLGWNMAVDPERLGVAIEARDSGGISLSGKVMVRDDVEGMQPGCLMMLPVYRRDMPVQTVEQRTKALEGWVFARFVTGQLMQRVMEKGGFDLHLRVYDLDERESEKLIFDNAPALTRLDASRIAWFESDLATKFGTRTWRLVFDTTPVFERKMRFGLSNWVAAGGALISMLLFLIAWSLGSTRSRALALASDMTVALRETNQRLRTEVEDRQRSEDALKHSESLYHSLVENLPLSIVRKDLEGRFVFANRRFCARHQIEFEDLLGKTDEDLFPRGLVAQRKEADRRVIETKGTHETVEERVQPDGRVAYIQAIRTPLFNSGGTVVGVLGIFWDVTETKRAEEALKHERFLLRTLMENLPDRIYFKDQQSRFIRNSRSHLKLFGLTDAKDAIGRSDFDFFSAQHARQAYEDEQRLMRTGETVTKEEKETWPDGTVSWAFSTKLPLRDEQGKVVGTFGITHDITDRKLAEEATLKAKEVAEAASRAKSQFLASMSHELRTPLNSVIGFANILLKNRAGNLNAADLNFLDRILANGKHLLTLINQILDLSKIEARKVELQKAPLVFSELVRDTASQQEGLVRDRPVKLLVDVPEILTPIVADAEKLKQVIINLVGNALKFTEQGSVTLRVIADSQTHVPVRLDVVDTGIGIPQDKLGLIFDAFQQAEAGTARKYGGTGLGLTISQALCQLMGYRIEVLSEVGKGSTFSICLDGIQAATQPASAVAPVKPVQALPEMNGKLVLVIDDELDSRTLLSHMVEEFGCQAISANSGEQGLHMAREFRPHLITVDLMMPHMDGLQVIRALKADPELRNIPVVVVSVVAGENRGGIIGAVDVLQKPVIREDLLAALRRCLPFDKSKILLVDDEADARLVLKEHLAEEACEWREACNGREALQVMEEFMPDLILLDLLMPEMDGLSFLNRIRSEIRYQWLPVIVVTAKELTSEERETLSRAAQLVVKKGDLFEADLRSVLRRSLMARPPEQKGGNV